MPFQFFFLKKVQDTVILAINSAASAKIFFKRHVAPRRPVVRFFIVCRYLS